MFNYLPEGFLINEKENKEKLSSPEAVRAAFVKGAVLEARASFCDRQHDLHVDLGEIKGIIPRTECAVGIDDGSTKDIAIIARVNKPVCFVITRITECDGRTVAYLSRKAVQEKFYSERFRDLRCGDIIKATVTHLEPFGVFCDIGCGINALLPIDNISVSRIPHPNVRFSVGDVINVIISKKEENGRITLSHKELLGTWEENAALFNTGETVSGIVRSVENYGIFIELTPNLAGLAEYNANAQNGQSASVYIKSILPDKMKFKLIIVDSFSKEDEKTDPVYFYKGDHIDYFRYSPAESEKTIETYFSN